MWRRVSVLAAILAATVVAQADATIISGSYTGIIGSGTSVDGDNEFGLGSLATLDGQEFTFSYSADTSVSSNSALPNNSVEDLFMTPGLTASLTINGKTMSFDSDSNSESGQLSYTLDGIASNPINATFFSVALFGTVGLNLTLSAIDPTIDRLAFTQGGEDIDVAVSPVPEPAGLAVSAWGWLVSR